MVGMSKRCFIWTGINIGNKKKNALYVYITSFLENLTRYRYTVVFKVLKVKRKSSEERRFNVSASNPLSLRYVSGVREDSALKTINFVL